MASHAHHNHLPPHSHHLNLLLCNNKRLIEEKKCLLQVWTFGIGNTINTIPGLSCDLGRDEHERVSCDLGCTATTTRERGRDERVTKRSGLSYDSATATRERGRDKRVIETWESEDWEWFLREAETSEDWEWLRKGFRVRLRVIFERGLKKRVERRLIRGKKRLERRRLRAETRQPSEPCEPVTVHKTGWFHAFFAWNGSLP